jgi:endogenous inhibitor of DNA gyrase (YacG/DUF329 family)
MNMSKKSCEWCGKAYEPKRYRQKFCSYVCGYTAQNQKKRIQIGSKPRRVEECQRCGKEMTHKKSHALYCSKTCKSMDHTFIHRGGTRIKGARRQQIIQRDGSACYMCGVNLKMSRIELDHLIPVSKGGTSDDYNVAAACLQCNRKRGNKITFAQLKKLAELGAIA